MDNQINITNIYRLCFLCATLSHSGFCVKCLLLPSVILKSKQRIPLESQFPYARQVLRVLHFEIKMRQRQRVAKQDQQQLISQLNKNHKQLLEFAEYFGNARQPTNAHIQDIDADGFTLKCSIWLIIRPGERARL